MAEMTDRERALRQEALSVVKSSDLGATAHAGTIIAVTKLMLQAKAAAMQEAARLSCWACRMGIGLTSDSFEHHDPQSTDRALIHCQAVALVRRAAEYEAAAKGSSA